MRGRPASLQGESCSSRHPLGRHRRRAATVLAKDRPTFSWSRLRLRLLFVLMLLAHDRRLIRHVAVTAHPTAAWMERGLPWEEAPRYLIDDRDSSFERLETPAKAMEIEEVAHSPAFPVSQCLRQAIHWIRPSRVPRSCDP